MTEPFLFSKLRGICRARWLLFETLRERRPKWVSRPWLEFLLPLPLIALAIWFAGKSATARILSYDYVTNAYLEADTQVTVQLSVAILAIEAEIREDTGFTKVSIKTSDSAIKTLELELPTTEIEIVETKISQELGLPQKTVQSLTRYQFTKNLGAKATKIPLTKSQ